MINEEQMHHTGIRYESSDFLVNKYAFVLEPVSEEDEKELERNRYHMYSRYRLENPENPNYGKYEQMWFR